MSSTGQLRYKRFIVAFISILAVFLLTVVSVILSHHTEMINEIRHDSLREMELMGNFTREALLTQNYSSIEQFLHEWAKDHAEILNLKATAPNGFIISEFHRTSSSLSSMDLQYTVRFHDRELLFLEMTKDFSPAQESMVALSIPLILGSVIMVAIIGLLLWVAMKKLALVPMEKEIVIREQAERKFRLLLESAPDAIIIVDKDGKITMVNAQTELLYEYKRNELIGKDIELLLPERMREKHRAFRDTFMVKPEARPMGLDMELYGLAKNGREFPADISLSPIETEEGLFILSAVRDVTERKRAEMKIRRSYNFQSAISSILSNSLEPVSLDDQLKHILDTILSIPGLSLESTGCIYLTDPESGSLTMRAQQGMTVGIKNRCAKIPFGHCLCGQAASKREIIFAECTDSGHMAHAAYDKSPHSHYCIPIVSGDRTLGVINLVLKKGHERSTYEESLLLSIANTLAGIIEHNRTDIERQELQIKLAQSEKLSALGRLTANVAHEIRTPLTLIGGFARRLSKTVVEKRKDREYLDIIISEVERLENILKNVLTFSREPSLKLEPHNIRKIIDDVLETFQDRLYGHSIVLEKQFNDTPLTLIDRDQVIAVLNNILTNAIDSMPEGGNLKISTGTDTVKGKDYAAVDVTDTGGGMSEENISRMFEPFYSTKVVGHGTGLGLSISKKIMEDHGGFITVYSKEGKGSTFKLFFPLERSPASERVSG